MKRKKTILLLLLFAAYLSFTPFTPLAAEEPLQFTLISEEKTVQPGHPFWVALRLKMQDHWHSYWKNPGDSGMPTAIQWDLPEGFTAGGIEWPYPQRFDIDSLIGYGYEGEAWLLTQITPSQGVKLDQPLVLKAHVRSLVCSDSSCLPVNEELSLTLPVSSEAPELEQKWIQAFQQARNQVPHNDWAVKAERSGDSIRMTLTSPDKNNKKFDKVNFFPEKMMPVEGPTEVQNLNEGEYQITFKADSTISHLKGVLLLSHPQEKTAIALDVPLGNEIALADPLPSQESELDAHYDSFFLALLLAFIGGAILNLMPCVLPVMSFKILSFVKMAGQNRSRTIQHGIAFSAGVVVSFWVLAGLLLLLQFYGHSVGWGFQLQEPLFIALLAALLLVFALSLFGVFEIGTSVMGLASDAQQRVSGLLGSFSSGILATTVATPCTGPFLGSAVGFAVTLSPILALLIFTSVGLGMAAPYLALTAFPSLLRFLPKPGAWMVTFKELMGFLMISAVLWLTWVFGAQTSSLGLFLLLSSFFLITFACWIYGKWVSFPRTKAARWIGLTAVLLCLALSGYTMMKAAHPSSIASEELAYESDWETFSPERVAALQEQGIPVFVDFTAKWCLICQANHVVLSMPEVKAAFKRQGVVKMKADWTRGDPVITTALKKFGRNSVPLYLYYGGGHLPPRLLPQVLTPEIVLSYMRQEEIVER